MNLDCPHPPSCPVPDPVAYPVATLPTTEWRRPFSRVFDTTWGYDEFNPGHGDTRFAPVTAVAGGLVPHMYGGATDIVVLLETVLRDLDPNIDDRIVAHHYLVNFGLVQVNPPRPLTLVDLRDPQLQLLGLDRSELVTSPSEHYPCTRRWTTAVHDLHPAADGMLWHSRQVELATGVGMDPLEPVDREVFVLFADRAPADRGAYLRQNPGVQSLLDGSGWQLISRLCDELDVTLDPANP